MDEIHGVGAFCFCVRWILDSSWIMGCLLSLLDKWARRIRRGTRSRIVLLLSSINVYYFLVLESRLELCDHECVRIYPYELLSVFTGIYLYSWLGFQMSCSIKSANSNDH